MAEILREEIGFSFGSPEPDWASQIVVPGVDKLLQQSAETKLRIVHDSQLVKELEAQIADLNSFRRLLFGTGKELEAIVKRSLEQLGAKISPSKYGEEEYILEFEGQEFLMEVKGVSKSISLSHLRQLNDYLLKYEEETGKECKGILFGNAWRNTPPEMRGTEDKPEFPENVVKRAETWEISLVSATAYFESFVRTINSPELRTSVLSEITRARGIALSSRDHRPISESSTPSTD